MNINDVRTELLGVQAELIAARQKLEEYRTHIKSEYGKDEPRRPILWCPDPDLLGDAGSGYGYPCSPLYDKE